MSGITITLLGSRLPDINQETWSSALNYAVVANVVFFNTLALLFPFMNLTSHSKGAAAEQEH